MSADLRIRPGTSADVAAVLALLDGAVDWLVTQGRTGQWGTEPQSTNPWRIAGITALTENGGMHLATIGDEVVGALAVGPAPPKVTPVDEPELYVRFLVSDRSRAGQGIGRRLLEHARELARAGGITLLRVDCYAGPDRALVRYYEGQGFTATTGFTVDRPEGVWPGQILHQRLS